VAETQPKAALRAVRGRLTPAQADAIAEVRTEIAEVRTEIASLDTPSFGCAAS